MMRCLAIPLAIVLLVGAKQLNAATITFNDQGAFLSAAGSVIVEDFESTPLVGTGESGAQSSITFTHFTANSTPAALKVLDSPFFGNHNTTSGGERYLGADTDIGNVGSVVTFISFDSPITELGLFLIDFDRGGGTVTINGNNYNIPVVISGGESYFGIIEMTPFTEVAIASGPTDSFFSMDDVVFNIPEPSTFVLALLATLGLSIGRRRRRRV